MAFCNLDKAFFEGIGRYDFPVLDSFNEELDIKYWIRFTDLKKCNLSKKIEVHFFQEDYKFESIWTYPNRYIDKLKKCGLIVQPDFSLFTDFPKAIQIYNKYRNHWLARFYLDRGIKVLPFVMWSTPDNYDWCFDGTPKNSIVSVTTNGTIKDKTAHYYFLKGFNEMMYRLSPKKVIVFTVTDDINKIGLKYDNVEYINCAVRKTLK